MFSFSTFTHKYDKSQFHHIEPVSKDYTVRVNGQEVPVYCCRISAMPFNTVWPDHQRYLNQTELCSFVNLVSDEELTVEVTPTRTFGKAFVKPYSKNVATETENGVIRFTIKENGGFVLGLDDLHHCLYLFNGKPIEVGKRENITHYFGPGVHMPGRMELHSGDRVYVDKDALVYGWIFAENQENIEIYGNGIFDDSGEERFSIHCYEPYTNGNFKMYDCKNIRVSGVGFRNSAIWCLNVFHCTDIVFEGVNVFGQWRYNTDGCDIVNSQNVFLNNCFIHSFDDTVSIKGIQRYRDTDNRNIHLNGCVFWCDWGKTCTLGVETYAKYYHDISFKNCDILRAGDIACDVQNGNNAEIYDCVFEDIRVEVDAFSTEPQYQRSDDEVYVKQNTLHIPRIFNLENFTYDSPEWGIVAEARTGNESCTHHVTAKDITVYLDERIPMNEDGTYPVRVHLSSTAEGIRFHDIELNNLVINGKKVTGEEIPLTLNNVDRFQMK